MFGFSKQPRPSPPASPNNKTLKNRANAARKAALAQLNLYKSKVAIKRGGKRSTKRSTKRSSRRNNKSRKN